MSLTSNLNEDQRAAVKEIVRRQAVTDSLLSDSFPAQKSYILDRSPFQIAHCTRRAGKSRGGALKLLNTALRIQRSNVLYVSLTRDTCETIMCKDNLDEVLDAKKIRHELNKVKLTYTFEGGSVLKLLGLDANEKEKRKALGSKYAGVVVDEGQDFVTNLKDLIMINLKPAVADYRGWIAMQGTPSNQLYSFYHDVSVGEVQGWSNHNWTAFDNPHMAQKWPQEIADLKKMYPNLEELPWFKQQYLGQWAVDEDKLCYRFNPKINRVDALPTDNLGTWYYVLSIDLGWEDPTAFTLLAYRDYDNRTYIVRSWKKSHMLLSDVQREITATRAQYPTLGHVVVDASAKQAVEELSSRLNFQLIPAEKAGKYDFIQILNSDLKNGNVVLVDQDTRELQQEWATLVWDEKALQRGVHKELESCHNHCSDSALYGYRFCYGWVERFKEPPAPSVEEQMERQEDEEAEEGIDKPWWEE